MRTTKVMTLSLPLDMVREVEQIISQEDRTRSEILREALRKYLNDRRWVQIRQWGLKASQEILD